MLIGRRVKGVVRAELVLVQVHQKADGV